jgi:hypothetical protein
LSAVINFRQWNNEDICCIHRISRQHSTTTASDTESEKYA